MFFFERQKLTPKHYGIKPCGSDWGSRGSRKEDEITWESFVGKVDVELEFEGGVSRFSHQNSSEAAWESMR